MVGAAPYLRTGERLPGRRTEALARTAARQGFRMSGMSGTIDAMTRFLLDVASYQGDLSPADVKRAGFTAVNLKISHGLGRGAKTLPVVVDAQRQVSRAINASTVHPLVSWWVSQARELGLDISTFHYFTADASGTDQANYAFSRLKLLRLENGTAHQLDVESAIVPDFAEVRAYLSRMTELLGRPVALYTGDWWWTARPAWNVSDLTPYLWAAPNPGYPGTYPGDTSPQWRAGYGGWPVLSVMQYAVAALSFPDGTSGTIKVSKSAIRDDAVWRALTLGRTGMSYPPATLLAARTLYIDCLAQAGFRIAPAAVGIVGDDSHANSGTSYHLGKDALKPNAYSIVESSRDRKGLTNAAMGIDYGWFEITVKGRTHNLRTFSAWLVAECKAGAADTLDIREVIYSLDGKTVKRWDRLGIRTTGDISHTGHTHESWFRDSEGRDKTAHLRRYFTEIGVLESDVSEAEVTAALTKFFAGGKQGDGTPDSRIGRDAWAHGIPNAFRTGGVRTNAYALLGDIAAAVKAIRDEDPVDESLIVASLIQAIVAGADDAAVKIAKLVIDNLPDDLAEQVADEIGDRIREARVARGEAVTGVDDTGGAPEQA